MTAKQTRRVTTAALALVAGLALWPAATPAFAANPNLVPNPSVETAGSPATLPSGWSKGGYGANTRVLSYPVPGHDGVAGLRTEITAYTDGDAKWLFSPVAVTPGQKYTYTEWYKANVKSAIVVRYQLQDGTFVYPYLAASVDTATIWTKYTTSLVVPTTYASPVVNATIYHLIKAKGFLVTDQFSLVVPDDATPPTVAVKAPAAPAVKGRVELEADATDDHAVAGVQFYVDGQKDDHEEVNYPYTMEWDTVAYADGSHVITAVARDAAGNKQTSAPLTVQVKNDDSGNLVPNAQFEFAVPAGTLPTMWVRGGSGVNDRAYAYPVAGYLTAKAARVDMTTWTSGDARWYFAPVDVTPGKNYDYVDYSKATVPTTIRIQYTLANGAIAYATLPDPVPASADWVRNERRFAVPTNLSSPVVKATVIHALAGAGSLTIDAVSLIPFAPPPQDPANVLPNGTLESISATSFNKPDGWNYATSPGATATFAYPTAGRSGMFGAKLSVSAYASGAGAKWYFLPIGVTPRVDYRYSDWYKSDAKSTVSAQVLLDDGTYKFIDLAHLVPSPDWKQVTTTFRMPAHAVQLTVSHQLQAVGTLQTDDYALVKLPANAFARGMVTFTFDDGTSSIHDNAIPKLNAAGIRSTQLIITGTFGFANYMTAAQVLKMQAQGHEIGAHTRTHPPLETLPTAQVTDEIAGSKADLAALGIDARTFAYPFGDNDDSITAVVQAAGFRGARSSREGFNTRNSDPFALFGFHAELAVPFASFKAAIDQAIADKSWLIFEIHDVKIGGDKYSITPDMLQQVIDYVKASGVQVATLGEGLAAMGR